MPSLYFDHNVSLILAALPQARGFTVWTARQLRLERASDAKHLLTAAQRGWLLVSHNWSHFEELNDGWPRWSRAWGVPQTHAGNAVIPDRPVEVIADLIVDLLDGTWERNSALYRWRAATGWALMPLKP